MPPDGTPTPDRRSVLKAAGALGAFFGSTGVAAADSDEESGSRGTELLIGVSPDVSDVEGAVQSSLGGSGRVVHSNEAIHYATVELPANTPEEAKDRITDAFESIDEIEYVEENATLESFTRPNDPHYSSQHTPQQVNCEGAWDETFGHSDVTISVVDTGTAYDHENLAENVDDRIGDDFVGRGSDPYPVNSNETHGTVVSGIAVGGTDNGTGHAGVSNCSMLSARALDSSGRGSLSDIADAIQWSADQGVDIINLSLGSSSGWHTLRNACQYAYDQGCLLVAAAGNAGGSVAYPAVYDSVIAVSALDSRNRLASFSNRGREIELAAPGTRVLSSTLGDSYTRASGTSMASPVVAGVAGLVLSAYPGLDNESLREHLRQTATDVGLSSRAQGYGRIDADAAVNTVPDGYEPEEPEEPEDDEEEDDLDDRDDHLLAFVTDPDASLASYEFTADGPVEFADAPYESPSGGSIEGGTFQAEDFIEEDDGTWHAGGVTGGGHGDAFWVDGAVTSIEIDDPDVMWVELDAEEMSPAAIIDETGGGDDEDEDDEDDDTGECGDETATARAEGSLSGGWWGGTDNYTYSLRTADPCSATLSLEGPDSADFDLYVTLDGNSPSRWNYDEASTGSGSDEEVTVDLSGDEQIRFQIHAADGSGEYVVTVEEQGK
ncbi:S8 family serine peptidase [Natronobacterium texcoconense]|uniref:Serine protease n=1 Tax=Natronobacterium texcoconense TaxID=1095778 RepID=A0A1H1GBM6_NATTX|nr:S8 family serine peptidase [Natronobacterium texcoconense]SDR10523.1 serine protease [Natronobacterium texcoconense]